MFTLEDDNPRLSTRLGTYALTWGTFPVVFGGGLAFGYRAIGSGSEPLPVILGVSFVVALAPAEVPRIADVALDLRALAFAFAIALLSGVLFGLAPALTLARTDLSSAFRAERFGSVGRSRLQVAMMIADQIAI